MSAAPNPARRPNAPRSIAALLVALFALLAVSLRADAQSASILHEFVAPDPREDVSFAATTLEGDLPAAIQTPSGVATAPDPQRPPDADHVYSGSTTDDSPDATFEPDRDTRRPNVESYDDPFSPATAPFKRLRAYDSVDIDYSLRVRDRTLRTLAVGGAVNAGDEPFYGDLSVDLIPDQPVRIPTVGPGARILKMHTTPTVPIEIVHDAADNWFARSSSRARVRLVVELVIPRATFGSEFADVEWSQLDALVRPQPAPHRAAFADVAKAIGITRSMRPREALAKMVEYFRSFEPSDVAPRGREDIYLDLALSKKGVCRHRSFAFLVTALNIGIPARLVVNEAHAWVEASDGSLWHRIDLGGAAANLQQENDPSRPPYAPPPDPYAWPTTQDSGQDLAQRSRNEQGPQRTQDADGGAPSPSSSAVSPAPSPTATNDDDARRPPSDVTIELDGADVRRGTPLHLRGSVSGAVGPCGHVRVDVWLSGGAAPRPIVVGSLSTDERGGYDGVVVVPRDFGLGDYDLSATTPGDTVCGPSRQR